MAELDMSKIDEFDAEGAKQGSLKVKGIVDIIFLLDVSGSMGGAIKGLVHNLENFVTKGIDPEIVSDWRIKVVTFSDLELDSKDIAYNSSNDFVSNSDDLQKLADQFIGSVKIVVEGHGGDEPESSLDALYRVVNEEFTEDYTKRRRVVCLFTDATPKAIQSETLGGDFNGLQELTDSINNNKVYVFMYAPKHEDYTEVSLSASQYCTYFIINPQGEDPVEKLNNQMDFEEVMKKMGKTITTISSVVA